MPSLNALNKALEKVNSDVFDGVHCHSSYIGLKKIDGKYTDEECVVIAVQVKLPEDELRARNIPLVQAEYSFGGEKIKTDVVELPMMKPLILYINPGESQAVFCHNSPVPSGVECTNERANWVGTLGGMPMRLKDGRIVALTNWHVGVVSGGKVGDRIVQPGAGRNDSERYQIGRLCRWNPITSSKRNTMDVCLLNCYSERYKGSFVSHRMYSVGESSPDIATPTLRQRVIKYGRTTSLTRGQVVGINAKTSVSYGSFVATFYDQVVVEGVGTGFSAAGDSGSSTCEDGTLKKHSLLFAGGGGTTILSPVGPIKLWAEGEFIKVK